MVAEVSDGQMDRGVGRQSMGGQSMGGNRGWCEFEECGTYEKVYRDREVKVSRAR